jgi:PAS domain S-box-containing protein
MALTAPTKASARATTASATTDAREVREVRERAAQIVAFATDAIISKDRTGVITSWNLGAELLYGHRAEEVVGRSISLIIPEQRSGEESRLLLRMLDGEHIDCYETTRLTKDGRQVDVSLTLFALRDDSGRIVGGASIAHDISTQVAAQRELQHSESLYRQILESTIEGVWNVNLELVTDYVNPSLARMLGYTVEEMLGRHLAEFLGRENLDDARESLQRQSEGASERLEQTFLCKDGAKIKVLMSVTAVFDGAGRHVGNMAIVTDVTQQRQTETHLHETETSLHETKTFLAGLTASMQEGLMTLDTDGRIVTVNHAVEDALGYRAAELIGQTLCASLGCKKAMEQRCDEPDCPLAALSSTRELTRVEGHAFVRRDGTRLPVDLSAAPIGTEAGAPSGCVVVFRDISERERASEHAEHELEAMSWIGRVRDAMSEQRLVLAAQPIVALSSGEVAGQELLLRMRSRAGELVMPDVFLPSAERFGLIGTLDRWVIGQAARMAAHGRAVNVNLSAQSLGDPQLSGLIEKLIEREDADPALVTFEITETALTEHLDLASRLTFRLAALGCEFALDDFGTGYGAFTYLKTLPIKHLKIDIEFVRDLLQNEASQHLVSATVQLARSFGQKTVAEGVEDAQTLERLRELEVDYVQGYFLGRPEVISFD